MLSPYSPINYLGLIKPITYSTLLLICPLISVTDLLKAASDTNAIGEITTLFIVPHKVEVPTGLH